ncbi:unnamed protein product [Albugo candida]|uniref:Peptidyl-prolyl cis-trans isomerase n=1 Tax=Albugo candida TaxID=65357 RepID=A0A024G959_9STRA|nr:unnamed protein product [Albugo candida]|eukprot:CCI43376.1 unnamed protein product [Albugo candida]
MAVFWVAVFLAQYAAFLDATLLAHARHILVHTEDQVDTIYREIHDSKHIEMRFIRSARAHSQCSSAGQNGDIGFVEKGQMGLEMDAILFEKEPKVVHKFSSPLGWHLLYIIERIDSQALRDREQKRSPDDSWIRVMTDTYNNVIPYIGPLFILILLWFGLQSASKQLATPARIKDD